MVGRPEDSVSIEHIPDCVHHAVGKLQMLRHRLITAKFGRAALTSRATSSSIAGYIFTFGYRFSISRIENGKA